MRLSLLVGLRVLRVDLTHHLRLLFVVLLDVLDGLLRLRRRNFYIHRRCRLRRPGGCKHDASALSIKMDLARFSAVILFEWQASVNCNRRFSEASGMRRCSSLYSP